MGGDHRCLEIAGMVMIADQNVKSQQSSGLMGIVLGNDAKLARQSVWKRHTGQCNLKAGVGKVIPATVSTPSATGILAACASLEAIYSL